MRALVNVPTNSSLTQAIERAVRAQEMGKAFQSKPRAAMIRMVTATIRTNTTSSW